MNPTVVKSRNDTALRKIVDEATLAITETLESFVDRNLRVQPTAAIREVPVGDWLSELAGDKAVIRATIDTQGGGHHTLLAFDLVTAITLAGHLMLTSEEVIQGDCADLTFDQEHHEAFSEVGNILCAAITGALRRQMGPQAGIRIRDFATVQPGSDPNEILGQGTAIVYDLVLQIDDYAEATLSVILDPDTAQAWNDAEPVFTADTKVAEAQTDPALDEGEAPTPEPTEPSQASDTAVADELIPDVDTTPEVEVADTDFDSEPFDELEDLTEATPEPSTHEATPTPGIAAYVTNVETASILRQASAKMGIEIRHYARREIPNPAAHPGEIVLIEIPVGEEKRFDWARRLKQYRRTIAVVLLIHEPSRARVVQGLLTRSNVILAWPSKEDQLRAKLSPLLDRADDSE